MYRVDVVSFVTKVNDCEPSEEWIQLCEYENYQGEFNRSAAYIGAYSSLGADHVTESLKNEVCDISYSFSVIACFCSFFVTFAVLMMMSGQYYHFTDKTVI